jgi:hypothetical protein
MDQELQQDAGDVPPWEHPGAYRRDCEPHRGEVLSALGTLSILLSLIGCISLGASAIVGFPLGLLVLYLARRDLAKMKVGQMDPHGASLTRSAWCLSVRTEGERDGGHGELESRGVLALFKSSCNANSLPWLNQVIFLPSLL